MYKRPRDAGDYYTGPNKRFRTQAQRPMRFLPFYQNRAMPSRQMIVRSLGYGQRPILPAEKKFVDQSVAIAQGMTANTAWAAGELDPATNNCINAVAQGSGNSQRVGMKYAVHSIEVSGQLQVPAEANQTAGDTAITTFIALVWDKQTNAAQLNSEDVYTSLAEVGAITQPLRNMNFSKRFKVLRTFKCVLKPPTLSWDGTNMEQGGDAHQFTWYVKFMKPVIVECSGTGATVASIMNHSFHVVGQASSTQALITYNSRVRYSDV